MTLVTDNKNSKISVKPRILHMSPVAHIFPKKMERWKEQYKLLSTFCSRALCFWLYMHR